MASRQQNQLNLPPALLQGSEHQPVVLRKSEQASNALRTAEQADDSSRIAAELFDAAVVASKLRNPEIAHLIGVSESLVQKWRSAETRECPSFVQMLRLPPAFHIELHRAMNKRFGFGRAALNRLLDAVSDLSLVVEA